MSLSLETIYRRLDTVDVDQRRATERWFIRRGIPHFIDDYSATQDVFTRAVPFLLFVALLEVLNALNEEWSTLINVLAFVGGLAILIGGYVGLNALRGRALFRRPDTIGYLELAAFIVVPAILPLVFGGQIGSAIATVVFNVFIVALTYGVVSFGLVPMTKWAIGQAGRQIVDIANLMVRSLPLLLLFATFLFLNAEIWQVADDFRPLYFATTLILLGAIGSLFVLIRLPREVEALRRFESWQEVSKIASHSPLADAPLEDLTDPPEPEPLAKRDWFNVSLVVVTNQGVQIVLVALLIFSFYVLFGIFTVRETTISQWIVGDPDVLWTLPGTDGQLVVTRELLRVAGFIAAFAGLQFTVSAITDEAYRREFFEEVVGEVRESFAVRALYLAKLN